MVLLLTTVIAGGSASGANTNQSDKKNPDLPRFFRINENLYRGAQPTPAGIRSLAELGIKTIVNLRGKNETTQAERDEAVAAGLSYFNIPLPDLSSPSDELVDQVLAIINNRANWPVFVHCNHGKDRTGLIIACYRISVEGKTDKDALREAKKYGLSWVQFGMKDYIGDYYKRWLRTKSGSTAQTSQGFNPPMHVSYLSLFTTAMGHFQVAETEDRS